jgi:hypothetical protein
MTAVAEPPAVITSPGLLAALGTDPCRGAVQGPKTAWLRPGTGRKILRIALSAAVVAVISIRTDRGRPPRGNQPVSSEWDAVTGPGLAKRQCNVMAALETAAQPHQTEANPEMVSWAMMMTATRLTTPKITTLR